MMALLVKPAIVGLLLVAGGPALPHLDVRRTCAETAGGDGLQRCMSDERYAERKLRKYWTRTPLALKRQCLLDPLPPSPSYVILRDCINNNVLLHKSHGD